MPAPFPLADLLALLRERKMEIGAHEHLTVGRLLSRWDDTDIDAFRGALAAVLARNPEEVSTVRAAFDELYRPAAKEKPEPSFLPPEQRPERRSPRWVILAIAAAVASGLILSALLWPRPEPPGPQPIASQGPSPLPQAEPEPLQRPTIPDTYPRPDWERVLAGAAGLAGGLLLVLYRLRLRRAAERAARRRWHEELMELPEPHGYEIGLGNMTPPFSPAALEEAASFLGRRALTSSRLSELDIDRTLQRTLHAGLAPQVVFRACSAAPSIVVLEDIGSEMTPWSGRASALLAGLAARGVPLDRWQFHADASRVFRSLGEPEISLRQLARMRAASPLLVISTGEGILEGWEGRTAPWAEQLALWLHRAWLHPMGDTKSWRPILRQPEELKISLWPMTPEGLLAAARHLAHGRPGPARATWHTSADRPVAPLDVDRLRWLLALAPRRDPELLERLRQEFCPHVPPAALLEALEAPPLAAPLGLPPGAGEVHAFLAGLLAASEPKPGTAAHERWRLDRALQEILVPGREKPALAELKDLARGPLAGQVGDAIEELTTRASGGPEPPLSGPVARDLRRTVLGSVLDRASRSRLGGWRRVPLPGWLASAAALLVALFATLALPALSPAFNREEPVQQEQRYTLRLVDRQGPGSFRLEVRGDSHWRDVPKVLVGPKQWPLARLPASPELPDSARGSWYYVRDTAPDEGGVLGISNYEWVERREAKPSTPPPPPPVIEPGRPSETRVLLVARDNGDRPLAGLRFSYEGVVSSPTDRGGATALDLPAGHQPGQQIKINLAAGYMQSEEWFLANPQVIIPVGSAAVTLRLMRRSNADGTVQSLTPRDPMPTVSGQRAKRLLEIEEQEAQLLTEFSKHDRSKVVDLKNRIDRLHSDLVLARKATTSRDNTDLDAIEFELQSLMKELQGRVSDRQETDSIGTVPAKEVSDVPGDLAGERARFEESLKIDERLAEANPSSLDAQRDLSVSLNKLGDVLFASGDLAAARNRFEESLKIRQRLAAANPSSAEPQRDLSVSLNKLGDVLFASGDLAAARNRFEESLKIRQRLAAANPSSAQAQRDLSVSLNELGNLLVASGNLTGARARFEESLKINERLAAANPTSAEAQRDLSVSLNKLGHVLVELGDLEGARHRFEEGLKIRQRLATANPTSADAQRDLSVSLDSLGSVLVASGDLAGARARFEASLKITENLAAANPTSALAQRDLSVSLSNLGDLLVESGDLAGARARFETSLKITERLAVANLTSADAQRDLSFSLNKIGDVLVRSGDLSGARALRDKPQDCRASGGGESDQCAGTARPDWQPLEARRPAGR